MTFARVVFMTPRQRHTISLVTLLALAVVSVDATAQPAGQRERPVSLFAVGESGPPAPARAEIDFGRAPLTPESPIGGARSPQPRPSRDSLKNGAIIGAVVGAAALGALGAFYCGLYQEEDGPSCRSDALRFAAIGAALGAGTGVALDAVFSRDNGVTVRMRVRF